jgi:aminopeptidase N
MLRARLGDVSFYRGIRAYYNEHKNSTATTEDLRRAFERASGKDLRAFFTRWVYESGHPQYELSWEWSRGRQLRLVLKQTQAGGVFLDPVPVVITTSSGKRDLILTPVNKQLIQTVALPSTPVKIELDPHNTLLKEATVKPL